METPQGGGVVVFHVFHGIEITPERPIDEHEAAGDGVEKRGSTGEGAGGHVVAGGFEVVVMHMRFLLCIVGRHWHKGRKAFVSVYAYAIPPLFP